jgi:ankyrin repeat protein/nucleoside phosphorylase
MTKRGLRTEDYTVGWVCALPIELAAATEMLDEEHQNLPQDGNDTNMYTLGCMGEHNVVLACLPAGQIGTNSAAAVAAQMKSKFTSIQFGLMVGIGGGVPSAEFDVRLGDVVISQPCAQHGGVVQYDLGKTGVSGFTRTGWLNAPPIVLLNALAKLRSNRLRGKDDLSIHLSAISEDFTRARAGPDILFQPTYNHIEGPTCNLCSRDRLVMRPLHRSKEVVVHYGTIASGNQVIKDGHIRDRLSSELGGVLCFEMEAAGLMNHFPCLVIRGICDYADSHKNKSWQPYAAATAAACAKELLSVIPTAEDTVKPEEQKARRDCLDVLRLTIPYDDRARLISTKTQRAEGTCEWIKDDKLYRLWLDLGSQLLWISGGPGKGKTMLAIFLTEELAKVVEPLKDAKLIFYFCDNQDEKRNTAIAILRGLLFQILKERPKLFKCILLDFETEKRAQDTITSLEALWRIFESMLRDPDFGTIYCVIDGLDECDEGSLQVLMRKLGGFFLAYSSRSTVGDFKLIVVSRELPRPITAKLSRFPRLKLDPDSDDKVNNDIKRFISVKVDELSEIEGFNDRFRRHIENALLERAEGTFLWVGFVINELLQKNTCTEVVETLQSLPKGLPGIYSRMLLQIKEDQQNTAAVILRWVVMSLRPLTLAELATAINIRPNGIVNSGQAIRDHVRSCGYFVKIREDGVGLIHQSARDYLLREEPDNDPTLERFRIKQEEADFELARTCFEYVQNGAFSGDPIDVQDGFHLRKFPLLNYAALHWPEHARRCSSIGEEMFDLSGPFCRKQSLVFEKWRETYSRTNMLYDMPNTFSLHLASYLGIIPLARKLLAEKHWKTMFQKLENRRDSGGMTPLHYAALKGHDAVVRLLIGGKADVNAKDNYGLTALYWAALNGHEAVVRLLIDGKADVNAKDNEGKTALDWAARNGYKAVVRLLLLDGKADVNVKDNYGGTALYWAALNEHEAVVQLLIDGKADVNAKDNEGRTALDWAARNGYKAVVRLLIDGKADVNVKDNEGRTVLYWAAFNRHEAVVRLLIDGKADVNAKDNEGRTALYWAARYGYEAVVRLLLDGKADASAKDIDGGMALDWAVRDGHEAVVRLLLLDGKADVNVKDNYGRTALYWAVFNGHEAVAQLLIDGKADVNAKGNDGRTALFWAATMGYEAVVRLLLDGKADINAKDNYGGTALHWAASKGHEAVVQLLLDGKADINAKNNDGRTALDRAALNGHEAVVRLLKSTLQW